jgi:hypothetical protein
MSGMSRTWEKRNAYKVLVEKLQEDTIWQIKAMMVIR